MLPDYTKIGIPQNYSDLYAYFGNPADSNFESTYIVSLHTIKSNGSPIEVRCHIAALPALKAIFVDAHPYIGTYDGCYVYRMVRGSDTHLSLHAWGLAIDINAGSNPLGSISSHQPQKLIDIFKDHGWFWGGNYMHRKDPMHFQRAGDF